MKLNCDILLISSLCFFSILIESIALFGIVKEVDSPVFTWIYDNGFIFWGGFLAFGFSFYAKRKVKNYKGNFNILCKIIKLLLSISLAGSVFWILVLIIFWGFLAFFFRIPT